MTAPETAAEAALRTQAELDRAVNFYTSLDEVRFARLNALELYRLNPESMEFAMCQMRLASLRTRQRAIERIEGLRA